MVLLLACAAVFAVVVTGRRGFTDWEIANLNWWAILSGIGAVSALIVIGWRLFVVGFS